MTAPITAGVDIKPDRRVAVVGLAGVVLGAVGFLWSFGSDPGRAWGSLLIADFYFLAIALGALFFLAMNYVLAAGWWAALRRIPEALASTLPWMAVPMLLIYFGRHELYHWTHADAVAHDPVLADKSAFLNTPFFFGRMVVILAVWTLFALALRRWSLAEDDAAEGSPRPLMVRFSAVFVMVFAVTFSLASFDWLMSLEPHWFSTIFAVYQFAGLFLSAVAAITLGVLALRRPLHRAGVWRPEHLHDLGKLMFAFSTFWAYIWLSQYLLIWYSHLPEEVTHYVARTQGGFKVLFFAVLFMNWVIPFLVLLPQTTKRRPAVLATVACLILVGRWLDLYVHVAPVLSEEPRIGLTEVSLFVGFAGVFVFLVHRGLAAAALVPRRDPFLRESLTYQS